MVVTKTDDEAGYILVEALVAAALLCIGLVLVAKAIQAPIKAARTTERHAQAIAILNESADRLRFGVQSERSIFGPERSKDGFVITTNLLEQTRCYRRLWLGVKWKDGGRRKGISTVLVIRREPAQTARGDEEL